MGRSHVRASRSGSHHRQIAVKGEDGLACRITDRRRPFARYLTSDRLPRSPQNGVGVMFGCTDGHGRRAGIDVGPRLIWFITMIALQVRCLGEGRRRFMCGRHVKSAVRLIEKSKPHGISFHSVEWFAASRVGDDSAGNVRLALRIIEPSVSSSCAISGSDEPVLEGACCAIPIVRIVFAPSATLDAGYGFKV
jgi:hypothetical protein